MIIETLAGIITAASTGVTAVYSVVRFNKKLQKEKLDRKRLLEDLVSLENSIKKINDYDSGNELDLISWGMFCGFLSAGTDERSPGCK